MLHPEYLKYKSLFESNDLAFQTKYDIINSQIVEKILPPFPSFQDKRNLKGAENYKRYCLQANYVSFPNICLDSVIGLANKRRTDNKPSRKSKGFNRLCHRTRYTYYSSSKWTN